MAKEDTEAQSLLAQANQVLTLRRDALFGMRDLNGPKDEYACLVEFEPWDFDQWGYPHPMKEFWECMETHELEYCELNPLHSDSHSLLVEGRLAYGRLRRFAGTYPSSQGTWPQGIAKRKKPRISVIPVQPIPPRHPIPEQQVDRRYCTKIISAYGSYFRYGMSLTHKHTGIRVSITTNGPSKGWVDALADRVLYAKLEAYHEQAHAQPKNSPWHGKPN